MPTMEYKRVISDLVGASYPQAVQVGHRISRNWVVRSVRPLPSQLELSELQQKLEDAAWASIVSDYAAFASPERLASSRPSIVLFRLHELHLLVRTEYASRETNVGESDMIAQWGVLQMLDLQIEIDDLQGLPSACWFPIRAAREHR